MSKFLVLFTLLAGLIPSIALASEQDNKQSLDSLVIRIHDSMKLSSTERLAALESINEELDALFQVSQKSLTSAEMQENIVDAFSYISQAQSKVLSGQ